MEDLKIKLDPKEVAAVDAHLEKHAKAEAPQTLTAEKLMEKGIDIGSIIGILGKVCAAYEVAKPVLDFAIKFLLKWKPSWQKAVTNVTNAIETACSFAPNP